MNAADTKKRLMAGMGWMVAWRLVTRVLGLATTLILARLLVPEDFGLLAIASSFAAAIQGMTQFALTDALVRRPGDARELYDTTFTLQAIRALITGALTAAMAPYAVEWFHQPRLLPIVLILAPLSCLNGFQNIAVVEFKRNIDFFRQFIFLAVPPLVQVVVTLCLALVFQSYWILVIGIAVANVGNLIMSYAVHPYRPRFALRGWREIMGFSVWSWASSLALIIWSRGDPIILGPALGTAAMGAYTMGMEIAVLPLSEVLIPVSEVLFTGFAKSHREGEPVTEQVMPVVTMLLLLVVPLAIGLSCTGGYIVAVLLGAKWHVAQHLVMAAAWMCLFPPLAYVCSSVLFAAGRVKSGFVAVALAAAVKLCVLLLTVQFTRDLTWIAGIQVICVGAESAFYLLAVRMAGPLRLRRSVGGLLRIGVAGLITTGLMWASGLAWHEVEQPVVPALLIGGGIGLTALLTFALVQTGLWLGCGRPQGPESRVGAIVLQALPGLLGRLRRRPVPSATPTLKGP